MAVVACGAVLPNLRETLIFCGRMRTWGHPVPVTRSDTMKPRSPRKLRHADTGSTRQLTENPLRSSRGPSLSPQPLYYTLASGTPRSPAVQHGGGRALPAAATPPGAGLAEGCGAHDCAGAVRPGSSTGARWGGLAGSGQSRKTGARAGSGCREERQAACSAALQGGTARLQQQPRPSRPRSAPSSHAGSGHSTNPPAPLRTKASRGFIRLCGGNSAQEFVRRRTFPPAQRVTGDPEPSVSQPWPAQIQPRTEHSVPQRVGSSKERPGLQSPSAV